MLQPSSEAKVLEAVNFTDLLIFAWSVLAIVSLFVYRFSLGANSLVSY